MAPRRTGISITDLVNPSSSTAAATPPSPKPTAPTQGALFPSITLDSFGFPIAAPAQPLPAASGDSTSSRSSSKQLPVRLPTTPTLVSPLLVSPTRIQDLSSTPAPRLPARADWPSRERHLKGPWKPSETALLEALVAQHGAHNWAKIAQNIPGRSGKQARERWKNHLDPALKKGNWTKAEDGTIMRLYERVGKKWSTIARELPGRSDNDVKNRYNAALADPRERALHDAQRRAPKVRSSAAGASRREMVAQMRAARPSVFGLF